MEGKLWIAACHITNAATMAVIAIVFGGFLRRRHESSIAYVFWCCTVAFGSASIQGSLIAIQPWWWHQDLFDCVSAVRMILFIVCAIALVFSTPSAMEIPNIRQIYERSKVRELEVKELRKCVHDLRNLAQELTLEVEKKQRDKRTDTSKPDP